MDTKEQKNFGAKRAAMVKELVFMVDAFVMEHATVAAEVVWKGEIPYTHTQKFLGIPYKAKELKKQVALRGWKLELIGWRIWILEDGSIAVQTGRNGPDLSVPVGPNIGPDQKIYRSTTSQRWDYGHLRKILSALHLS